jgi:nitroreductase
LIRSNKFLLRDFKDNGERFSEGVASIMGLSTKEAIEQRRSIRKFKSDPVPCDIIMDLIDAARLAPSGSNAQPWRFKIVTDEQTRRQLAAAAYHQTFIQQAPVVLVCCADIEGYLTGTVSGAQDLGKIGALEPRIVKILKQRAKTLGTEGLDQIGPKVAANVAIAIEHIVLRALDFGLGTCWVRMVEGQIIKEIFGWGENIYVVALLPIGFPAESPPPRRRLNLNEILID